MKQNQQHNYVNPLPRNIIFVAQTKGGKQKKMAREER